MALVLSPWFGRGCGRRARPFSFGSPSLFTDLVIIKVPQMQRQASCAPVQGRQPAMSNVRVVQWSETADSHIFKLRLPGLKKEDLHVQVEDDRTLYISYNNQPKEGPQDAAKGVKESKAAGEAATRTSPSKEQKSGGCSFMRKFKLPENADLEQIKAEVVNETLTVTVPKRKPKSAESRSIEVSEGGAPATNPPATSSATPAHEVQAAEKSEQPSPSDTQLPSA
ncbi:hypothetical protein KC19_8G128500 [Ceratodon purpureus]|uniref:SHSP domain-containing protein n=1 Tax=Ceratodon purpureus TaxID=3225 RepID=A0A8T0H0K6_CERPU|nr:hypothetical protein KC19_8G128500 [Ceratodon purpureus]